MSLLVRLHANGAPAFFHHCLPHNWLDGVLLIQVTLWMQVLAYVTSLGVSAQFTVELLYTSWL